VRCHVRYRKDPLTEEEKIAGRRWRICIKCGEVFEMMTIQSFACILCRNDIRRERAIEYYHSHKDSIQRKQNEAYRSVNKINRKKKIHKIIPCIRCKKNFLSEGKHNRMCSYCRNYVEEGLHDQDDF
jgi:hypothetical protein